MLLLQLLLLVVELLLFYLLYHTVIIESQLLKQNTLKLFSEISKGYFIILLLYFVLNFPFFYIVFFSYERYYQVIFLLGCWNVASGLYQIEYRLLLKNREKKMKNELEKWNGIDHKLLREISVLFCIGLVVLTLHCILNSLFLSFYFKFNCEKHGDKKNVPWTCYCCNTYGILLNRTCISIRKICCIALIRNEKKILLQNAMPAHKNTIWKSRLEIFSTFNLNVWISNQRFLPLVTHRTTNIRTPFYCFTF